MKSNCCGKLSLKYIKYLPIVPGGIVSVCTRKISSDKPLVNLSLLEQVLAGPFSDEVCPSPCNDRFRSSTERSGATFRCTRLLLQRVGYSSSSDSPGEGMESSSATSSAGGVDKEETIVDWTTKPLPGDLPRRQLPPRRYHQTTDSNITHVSGKRKPSSPSADAGAASSVLEDLGSIEEIKLESRSKPLNLLSETERCRFIKAIVTEKLKELALRQGKDTAETTTKREEDEATLEALRYQAQLEIQWIEDWAWDHPLHLSFNSVEQPSDKDFPEDEIKQRRLLVKRALLELIDYQKPLPYIIGTHPFYGCVLHCRPPVICPQAETEMWTHWLIESLLKPVLLPAGGRGGTRILNATSLNGTDKTKQEESMITPIRVLDMCCGTGCVGIAMAKHLPECSVVGVDIDPRAVELASLNAVANGVPLNSLDDKGRYISIQGNMFAALHSDEGTRNGTFSVDQAAQDHRFGFDVLVCNPPYLFPEEYAALPVYDQYWLPKLAVLGDPEREGAQQYRYFQELCEVGWQMLRQKKDQHLALHGIPNFVVEVGQQAALVAGMMEKAVNRVTGASLWEDIELHLDFNQQPRKQKTKPSCKAPMVLVECKRLPKEEYSKDYDVFLMSFTLATNVGEATDAVQKMQNTRVRLRWIIAAAKQLAKDSVPDDDQKHHLLSPVEEAERYLAIERASSKLICEQSELDQFINTFKGAVAILFPAECSGTDVIRRLTAVVEDDSVGDAEKSKAHRILSILDDGAKTDVILDGPVVMWWSARSLDRSCDFAKYLGKNEKTKITVKLAPAGAAPPPREAAIDTKTQAELMAHYYKKQEEMKKLIEDDDISFGNSEWANPKGLKSQLMGMDNVKYKPF